MQAAWRTRLTLGLLLAPALLWLFALLILPHIDLALLSLRERIGPREYVPSLLQYRTFFSEPLYWHVFVRTAVMSVLATAADPAARLSDCMGHRQAGARARRFDSCSSSASSRSGSARRCARSAG